MQYCSGLQIVFLFCSPFFHDTYQHQHLETRISLISECQCLSRNSSSEGEMPLSRRASKKTRSVMKCQVLRVMGLRTTKLRCQRPTLIYLVGVGHGPSAAVFMPVKFNRKRMSRAPQCTRNTDLLSFACMKCECMKCDMIFKTCEEFTLRKRSTVWTPITSRCA